MALALRSSWLVTPVLRMRSCVTFFQTDRLKLASRGTHRTVLHNLSWGHLLVVAMAALFVLGPQRLPEAVAWLGQTIRQVRQFAGGARAQLQREMGPELDTQREPLQALHEPLRELRALDPRRAPLLTLFDHQPAPRPGTPAAQPATYTPPPTTPRQRVRLAPGERPPIDTGAI